MARTPQEVAPQIARIVSSGMREPRSASDIAPYRRRGGAARGSGEPGRSAPSQPTSSAADEFASGPNGGLVITVGTNATSSVP